MEQRTVDFFPLLKSEIELYQKNPGLISAMIGKYWVHRAAFLEEYEFRKHHAAITAIEDLPVQEKNRLWLVAKKWCPDGNVKERTDTAKAIYILEYSLSKKIES